MGKIVTTKSLKKFTELLSRSEGISILPIVVVMVIMSVMGGVFTTIIGGWKINSVMALNSKSAIYLADTAEMFALQDASYRFYGGNFNYGTNDSPYVVLSNSTEEADYWFEMPALADDDDDDSYSDDASSDDSSSASSDSESDDTSDDDTDDISNPTRYSIIATGRIKRGGTTVAKRQIKIKADIIRSPGTTVTPGVQTSGDIAGTISGFGMVHNALTTEFEAGNNIDNPPGSEAGIVIRPAQQMDEYFVKALAIDQGHYNDVNLTIGAGNDNYPEPLTPSFYYDSPADTLPNFTYVGQHLTVNSGYRAHGVIWVKGNVTLTDTATMDAIIICEGTVTFTGNSNIVGGIIHYGSVINGNGELAAVTVNDAYFNALSVTIPIVNVVSWKEALPNPF